MNRPTLLVLSTLVAVYMDTAVSELKKYREWPSAVRVPSPEIKRQYELDPEAGAISSKLLSTSHSFMYGSRVVSSSYVNYKNSVAVSGTQGWNYGVSVYHGFSMFTSFDLATTQKFLFQAKGKWPANDLKIYTESVDTKGNLSKVGISCRQIKSFPASNIFPSLPGKLYKYECSNSTGTISDGFTWAPGVQTYTTYYSDYLDTPIFNDMKFDPPVVDGVQGITTMTYSFIDQTSGQQKITLPDVEMKSLFSRQ
ncbi:hypothetical protein SAMN04490186_5913 [Pseudomonas grimontii]|uniref:Uncharacterized protein n=1 Tax=Pseudomonas grimontii TaxID=129847 RepID=A0A1H1IMF6_9PSED|nr:hypothetical protein [Pseudomonas grimontii]TWR70535.1 hypothetical protein FIV39_04135 [Pseudomonas grimontii]SDR38864.1 hypothetical protein SAMN04490186_5913 [Pseudomonas grimontii]